MTNQDKLYYDQDHSNSLITQQEIKRKLKISISTLIRWRNEGMPYYKGSGAKASVRYDWQEVKDWLRKVEESSNGKFKANI